MEYKEWEKITKDKDGEYAEIELDNGHKTTGHINLREGAVFWASRFVPCGGEYFHYSMIKSIKLVD